MLFTLYMYSIMTSFELVRAMVEQIHKNKKLKVLIINTFSLIIVQNLWCHQESNRGHMDFQSIALPTELWHLLFGLQIYISNLSNQNFELKKSIWIHFTYMVHLQPDLKFNHAVTLPYTRKQN